MSKISELSDGGVIQGGDTLIAVRSGGNVKVTYGGTTTANIDGGTIDGTTIGGTTPAAGSFTTGSFTGNVSFGDNDKAIFGAGSDLQIYHDGSNSRIDDTGTGNLIIRAADQLYLGKYTGETYLQGSADGPVRLFHNGLEKLETTSTGIDVTGVITTDGMTTSANINFGDNDKAVFGAGSDLQIYHDGSNSYVTDQGTGNLILRGGNFVVDAQTSGNARLITANATSKEVKLYNNDNQKLATTSTGIDVTGTVIADGTFNPNTSNWANASFKGTGSYGGGIAFVDGTAGFANYVLSSGSAYRIGQGSTSGGLTTHFQISNSGDVSLYEDTGTTAKFFWDSSTERLGLGTDSPARKLTIQDDSAQMSLVSTTGSSVLNFGDAADDNIGRIEYSNSDDSMRFRTNTVDAIRINSSGNVGLGTNFPAYRLGVQTSATNIAQFATTGTTAGLITFSDANTAASNTVRLGSAGNNLAFYTNSSGAGAERMRITSAGHLLVGKTTQDSTATVGFEAKDTGQAVATASNVQVFIANRTTSDGTIAEFRKSNTKIGEIGVYSGDMIIGLGNHKLRFFDGSSAISPCENDGTINDNTIDLGVTNSRFKDLRLAGTGYFGTSIGIGTTSPSNALTVVNANSYAQLRLASSETNAANKYNGLSFEQYSTSEEGYAGILGFSNSTENRIAIGGSTGLFNAATSIQFFTAANSTTTIGTEAMRINSAGILLIGKTSTGPNNVGTQLSGDGYGSIVATSNNIPLYLENKAVGGNCRMSFKNESHGGASIGVNNGGDFTIFDATAATTRFNVTDAKILTATGGLAGIELGGVGVANRLDDYEEGTWTPTLTDGTTTVTQTDKAGSYVKVGNIVSIYFQIINASVSGLTGSVKIGGLPFTSGNTRGNGIVQFNNVVDGHEYYAQKSGSNTYLELKRSSKTTSETASSMLTGKFSEGTSDLFGSVTYTI